MPEPHLPLSLRRQLTTTLVLLMVVAVGAAVLVQQSPQAAETGLFNVPTNSLLENPTKYPTVAASLGDLNDFLVKFAGVAAIFAFFTGAYSYFLSAGNEEQLNKGKMQMVGSIIALFIILSATGIVKFFADFFAKGK